MAMGRALQQHRIFGTGSRPVAGFKRRHLALVLLASIAGAAVSFSLALDPPDPPPPRTSYLPEDLSPTPAPGMQPSTPALLH